MPNFTNLTQIPVATSNLQILSAQAFVYSTDMLTIAAGATVTAAINIAADSDFWLSKQMASNGGVADSGLIVSIKDTGDGKDLQQPAVAVENMFGSAQLPYILPTERIVRANSVLMIQVTNTNNAEKKIQLSFGGLKVYYANAMYGTSGT